jgi:hypothetical protein
LESAGKASGWPRPGAFAGSEEQPRKTRKDTKGLRLFLRAFAQAEAPSFEPQKTQKGLSRPAFCARLRFLWFLESEGAASRHSKAACLSCPFVFFGVLFEYRRTLVRQ